MGYDAVMAYRHLKGESVDERIERRELATTENVDDPRIHSLLFPESTD